MGWVLGDRRARGGSGMKSFGIVVAAALLALVPSSTGPCGAAFAASGSYACCKVCSKGKACGNSCIARYKTCHKGKGCACNG